MDAALRAYARVAKRRQNAAKRAGIPLSNVPIEKAYPLLEKLMRENAWTTGQAADALEIHKRTVSEVMLRKRPTVSRTTYNALLNPREISSGIWVNVYLVRQMLWSLRALGYNTTYVATQIGIDHRVLVNMVSKPSMKRVKRETYDKVRAVYDRIGDTPGPDVRAARQAAREGWLPPIFYDERGRLISTSIIDREDRKRFRAFDRNHRNAGAPKRRSAVDVRARSAA